jgi:hypothetical protein
LIKTSQHLTEAATALKPILITFGSGTFTIGFTKQDFEMIILGIIGFILGGLAWLYEYAHSENRKERTKLQKITEVIKYTIFGGLAMPSAVLYAGRFVDDYPIQILSGGIAAWLIVDLLKVSSDKARNIIKNWGVKK